MPNAPGEETTVGGSAFFNCLLPTRHVIGVPDRRILPDNDTVSVLASSVTGEYPELVALGGGDQLRSVAPLHKKFHEKETHRRAFISLGVRKFIVCI
ncbi:MAG: hypothetical protein MUF26_02525 [Syntrophales bacterium]|nr:hypothetical protein [Syntrophales bacterium]